MLPNSKKYPFTRLLIAAVVLLGAANLSFAASYPGDMEIVNATIRASAKGTQVHKSQMLVQIKNPSNQTVDLSQRTTYLLIKGSHKKDKKKWYKDHLQHVLGKLILTDRNQSVFGPGETKQVAVPMGAAGGARFFVVQLQLMRQGGSYRHVTEVYSRKEVVKSRGQSRPSK